MCVSVSVHLCTLVQARVDIGVFLDCYVVFEIRSLKDSAMPIDEEAQSLYQFLLSQS